MTLKRVASLIRTVSVAVLLGALTSFAAQAAESEYVVDSAHSSIGFEVRHLMISKVNGYFRNFVGEFTFDPDKGTLGNHKFEAEAKSIDTGNAKRDGHLRSADFFDVEKYPTLSITNSKIKRKGKKKYELTGDLNMHGVTKPIKLEVKYLGSMKDPQGNTKVAFSAEGKIKRSDWGLNYNQALEAGGVVISDKVELNLEIQAFEKPAQKASN